MIKIIPNPNMTSEDARRVLLDFLSLPNDYAEELSEETLQNVVNAVLSLKKNIEGERRYDRISSVDFVGKTDGDIGLGAGEEGVSKNNKIYISDKHLWQDSYRFSLVSLLFHESTHSLQYFKLEDLSNSVDFPLKPESKNPANLGAFKSDLMSYLIANDIQDKRSILHMFESDYYGQARELEAYKFQERYMTEILRDLKPKMEGTPDGMMTYESYKLIHKKYFPQDYKTRHEKDEEMWRIGRELIKEYMCNKLENLQQLKDGLNDDKSKYVYATNISNVVAGLHFNFDKDIFKQIEPHILNMPEDSFDNMSNKAMVINSLITSTNVGAGERLIDKLGELFGKLSVHPDNGKVVKGQKNIKYSKEKFYSDYFYLGKRLLDKAMMEDGRESM